MPSIPRKCTGHPSSGVISLMATRSPWTQNHRVAEIATVSGGSSKGTKGGSEAMAHQHGPRAPSGPSALG